jgi:FecR protein
MTSNSRPTELFQIYADGTATEAQVRELAARLRSDATLRDQYLEYLNIDLALEDYAANQQVDDFPTLDDAPISRAKKWLQVTGLTVAATVLALILIGQFPFGPPAPDQSADVGIVAEITRLEKVNSIDGHQRAEKGAVIRLSRVAMTNGILGLRLASGIELEFQGPVFAAFDSPMRLSLNSGRVNADVGAKGRGFTVVTSAGEVVDLGTRFSVFASANGETETAVFSGEVKVNQLNGAGILAKSLELLEGEAVRFGPHVTPRRISSLQINPTGMITSPLSQSGPVSSVSDNLTEHGFNRYYGVVAGGFDEGTLAYTDHLRPRWQAQSGQSFPVDLRGGDLIRTFHADRHDRDLRVEITLSKPAIVYVIRDTRKEPPDWLSSKFQDTGWRLRCGPWRVDGSIVRDIETGGEAEVHLDFAVWRLVVPNAGVIELGASRNRREAGPLAMYGVVVKSLSQPQQSTGIRMELP